MEQAHMEYANMSIDMHVYCILHMNGQISILFTVSLYIRVEWFYIFVELWEEAGRGSEILF